MDEISSLISEIKNIEVKYLTKFSYQCEYGDIHRILEGNFNKLKNKVGYYYEQTDSIQIESHKLSKDEIDLISGYSLFNTLIEFHSGISEGLKYRVSVLKPHKMLRKLERMFVNHAKKRDVSMVFTNRSFKSTNEIRNYSEIYIAFFSLVENAIKYSLNNQSIVFDIYDLDSETYVKLSNTCEKLSKKDMDEITKIGYKGENSKGAKHSSGLGLHIVNEIFVEGNISYHLDYENDKFIATIKLKNLANGR